MIVDAGLIFLVTLIEFEYWLVNAITNLFVLVDNGRQ